MVIHSAEFIISNTDFHKCPHTKQPEFAFIGRSNVGKSSVINMLTNHKNLAKTSSTPGKTQTINHFHINESWYLVDLPGYGWAKIAKTERESWDKMTKDYLQYRENLMCVFVLVDSRIEPQKIDLEFIEWLGKHEVPFVIIFTKTDKQTISKVIQTVNNYKKLLLQTWDEVPEMFTTSAVSEIGKSELMNFIEGLNQNFLLPK